LSINHHSKARKLSIIIINKYELKILLQLTIFLVNSQRVFVFISSSKQQENNNNNLEPATPSMLGVA